MLIKRVVSEFIDLFAMLICVALGALLTYLILGRYGQYIPDGALPIFGLFIIALPILLQCLFWKEGRSIGKTYMGLKVVNEETGRTASLSQMVVREIFSKWLSLYSVCLPLFMQKKGVHEIASKTVVISKRGKEAC